MKTVEEQIDEIVKKRYNDYKGSAYRQLYIHHMDIKEKFGSRYLLQVLIKCEAENPKPVHKIPEEYIKHKNK